MGSTTSDIASFFLLQKKSYVEHKVPTMRSIVNLTGPLSNEQTETATAGEEEHPMVPEPADRGEVAPMEDGDSVLGEQDTEMEDVDSELVQEDDSRESSSQPATPSLAQESNAVTKSPVIHAVSEDEGEGTIIDSPSQLQTCAPTLPTGSPVQNAGEGSHGQLRPIEAIDFVMSDEDEQEIARQVDISPSLQAVSASHVENGRPIQPLDVVMSDENEPELPTIDAASGSHVEHGPVLPDEIIPPPSPTYNPVATVPVTPPAATASEAMVLAQPEMQFPKRDRLFHASIDRLGIVQWKPPNVGRLPENDAEYLHCIHKIKDALADTEQVRDGMQYPHYLNKFLESGVYEPIDFQSVAVSVVQQAVRLCTYGATNMTYKTRLNHPVEKDANLEFGHRLHWIEFIVTQFKKAANDVMCDKLTETFLIAPSQSYRIMDEHLKQWEHSQVRRSAIAIPKPSNNPTGQLGIFPSALDQAPWSGDYPFVQQHRAGIGQMHAPSHLQEPQPTDDQEVNYMRHRIAQSCGISNQDPVINNPSSKKRTMNELCEAPLTTLTQDEKFRIMQSLSQGIDSSNGRRLSFSWHNVPDLMDVLQQGETFYSTQELLAPTAPDRYWQVAPAMAAPRGQPPRAAGQLSMNPERILENARPVANQIMGPPHLPQQLPAPWIYQPRPIIHPQDQQPEPHPEPPAKRQASPHPQQPLSKRVENVQRRKASEAGKQTGASAELVKVGFEAGDELMEDTDGEMSRTK
jgi:hypothetical protein